MIVVLGISLLWFYGILFLAALVNLPASWMGFLYSGVGLGAGLGCLVYLKYKLKTLLVLAGLAFLFMAVTLSGIIK